MQRVSCFLYDFVKKYTSSGSGKAVRRVKSSACIKQRKPKEINKAIKRFLFARGHEDWTLEQ